MFEVKTGDLTRSIPIIFPNELVHSMVAEALTRYTDKEGNVVIKGEPVSAGTVRITDAVCGERSSTLDMSSREGDDDIINWIDYGFGIK